MPASDIPPGWSYNPSRFRERLPVLLLALLACGIATYLTLYQLDVLPHVWEPFFGNGSKRILKESAIARALPVPDASLGALGYLVEVLTEGLGGDDRWRRRPWLVVLLGLTAAGLAVGGILLAIAQPVFFGALCTLCLASALCSVLIAAAARHEVLATLQYLNREAHRGRSVWQVLWGAQGPAAVGG